MFYIWIFSWEDGKVKCFYRYMHGLVTTSTWKKRTVFNLTTEDWNHCGWAISPTGLTWRRGSNSWCRSTFVQVHLLQNYLRCFVNVCCHDVLLKFRMSHLCYYTVCCINYKSSVHYVTKHMRLLLLYFDWQHRRLPLAEEDPPSLHSEHDQWSSEAGSWENMPKTAHQH